MSAPAYLDLVPRRPAGHEIAPWAIETMPTPALIDLLDDAVDEVGRSHTRAAYAAAHADALEALDALEARDYWHRVAWRCRDELAARTRYLEARLDQAGRPA